MLWTAKVIVYKSAERVRTQRSPVGFAPCTAGVVCGDCVQSENRQSEKWLESEARIDGRAGHRTREIERAVKGTSSDHPLKDQE